MKKITYGGPGALLDVPGLFKLRRGESEHVDDVLGEQLVSANPHLNLTLSEPDSLEPPRTGRGSGREAWAEYAATVGVPVEESMSRDDIVDAVDAASKETDPGEPEADHGEGHTTDHTADQEV